MVNSSSSYPLSLGHTITLESSVFYNQPAYHLPKLTELVHGRLYTSLNTSLLLGLDQKQRLKIILVTRIICLFY